MFDDLSLAVMVSMGKIQPEDIDADLDELQQFIIGITGWPYGCNDLRFMKSMLQTRLFVHILVQVLREIL
jgi:hypothetical protein